MRITSTGCAVESLKPVDSGRQISRPSRAGSSRYAHELDLPGLRFQTVRKFPYLVSYVEQEAGIDVWRVLHAARDTAA